MAKADDLKAMIAEAESIVAFTGAGISTESGIPDFRSPGGIWTKYRPIEFGDFVASAEARREAWRRKFATHETMQKATPNAGHRALVELERRGRLHALVTQNIDGLHQLAGSAAEKVIEVHGTMREAMCMQCAWRGPMPPVLDRVRAGEDDPPCEQCCGILKSATISFGQALVPAVIDRAMLAAASADLLLAIGTSLQVYPIAGIVPLAKSAGARVVIINAQPTPFDDEADAVLREPIGEILPVVCGITTELTSP